MGTYSDDFNERYTANGAGPPLSSAPQLVILSGSWDAHAETSELMEYELLSASVSDALEEMRRSAVSNAGVSRDTVLDDESMMMEWETALGTYNGFNSTMPSRLTLVPDTNVMISYLGLLDLFVQFISLCPDLSTSVLIPGIVMSELDGLRKNAQRTCAVQAQNANRWVADRLMAKIREGGAGVVRGQRDAATLVSGGSWRRHYYENGKVNPDGYIIDCAFYEKTEALREGYSSSWVVLTLDENCAAQCLANDLAVLKPRPTWTLQTLVHELFHDRFPVDFTFTEHHDSILRQVLLSQQKSATAPSKIRSSISTNASSQNPDWARSSASIRRALAPVPLNSNTYTPVAGMDLDDDHMMVQSSRAPALSAPPLPPPRQADPRDELKDQLIVYLTSALPPLIEASFKAHQTDTQSSSPLPSSPKNHSNSSIILDGSMHSIHAPRPAPPIPRSSSSPYLATTRCRRRELPSLDSTEWRSWRLHEYILFLADYPPPAKSPLSSSAGATTSSPPQPFSSQQRTHLTQLSTFVREETRRGREYGRGDWDQACNGVKVLFPELEDVISKAVIDVFEGGLV